MSAFNEFDAACADAFVECGGVFGQTTALLDGVELTGILDQKQSDRSLVKGGEKSFRQCTLMVSLDQFSSFPTPLEDSLVNKVLTLGTLKMRIEKALVDEMNVSLMLDDAAR